MTSLEKLDEVIRLTVMVARCAEPTTTDYKELTERRNALVHELRAALMKPGFAQVPVDPPESLRGQLCGYGADLSYMNERDRDVILRRGAERWAEILRWAGALGVDLGEGGKTK